MPATAPRAPVYLDHNASAPVEPAVRDAMIAALDLPGNPSSVHGPGRAARAALDRARADVAGLVGCPAGSVLFTSGGTEANALALAGPGPVLASAIEHDSVLAAAPGTIRVPVGGDGVVDLSALERLLAEAGPGARVALMLANNETGAIQPVVEASAIARRHGARVHCDAVQAAGRLDLTALAGLVDTLALSAHKIGGPKGVGALIVADGAELSPILRGGGQERRRRAGTENVAGIVGFGAAARLASGRLQAMERVGALRDAMEARLRAAGGQVFCAGTPRVANTSCVAMPGVAAQTQVMAFDLAGIAVSAGAACSSGKIAPSHVLAAMGVPADLAGAAVRVSLGPATGPAEIDRLVEAWVGLARRAGRHAA